MAKRDSRGWLWTVPILVVLALTVTLILVYALKKSSSCSSMDPNIGDCEEFEADGICYCIVKESTGKYTQLDIFQLAQHQCGKWSGELSTPDDDQLLKWLAKRLLLKAVDRALIGLKRIDSKWVWITPEVQVEAIELEWRDDQPSNPDHRFAMIDVVWYNEEGAKANYDDYLTKNDDAQWYGFSSTNGKDNRDKSYFVCYSAPLPKASFEVESTTPTTVEDDFTAKTKPATTAASEIVPITTAAAAIEPPTTTAAETESANNSSILQGKDRVFLFGGDNPLSWENVESFSPAAVDQNRIEVVLNLGVKYPVAGVFHNKVLVAGGRLPDGTSSKAAVLYDPIAKTVTKIHHMLIARHNAAAVALEDEDAFVVCGGYSSYNGSAITDCEKYLSNSTGGYSWTYHSSMGMKRSRFALAELNGKLYAIAGWDGGNRTSSVESYDPKVNSWSYTESYPVRQQDPAGVTFDNHIFVCGGRTAETTINECYKYSDITNKWTQVAGMTKARYSHAMAVAHGSIFVFHGHHIEVYDKDRDIWELQETLLIDYREYSAAVTFPQKGHVQGEDCSFQNLGKMINTSEHILLFGGWEAPSQENVESFYPSDVTLNEVHAVFDLTREDPVAVAVGNNILVAGGRSYSEGDSHKSAVLYDPISKTFTKVQDMIHARHHAAAAVLDDIVFMCGGTNYDEYMLHECEKYVSNTWTPFASMRRRRKNFAMAELNGLIYAIGGYDSSVESYSTKTDKWYHEPALPATFYGPKAATFDGHIYLCGGKKDGTLTSECFKYSDSTMEWTPAAGLIKEQDKHSMVVVNGMLFSFYGYDVEMYQKTFDKWVPGRTELLFERFYSSAVTFKGK